MKPSESKLIIMANQIAQFFSGQKGDATEGVARHLKDFWTPDMRATAIRLARAEAGAALSPISRKAIEALSEGSQTSHADTQMD